GAGGRGRGNVESLDPRRDGTDVEFSRARKGRQRHQSQQECGPQSRLRSPGTDRTFRVMVIARRAVFAPEVDDLQMAFPPLLGQEQLLQIALGLLDVLRLRQPPARGEAM